MGSIVTAYLGALPEISAKLKAPHPVNDRPLSEVVGEVKQSIVLVSVY
jgi:hypothetical protein